MRSSIKYRIVIIGLVMASMAGNSLYGQEKIEINFHFQTFEGGEFSADIHKTFDSLMYDLHKAHPEYEFDYKFRQTLDYNSIPSDNSGYNVYTLTPLKFIQYRTKLKNSLKPILVIHDSNDKPGYYSPILVANTNSGFEEINESTIPDMNLYLVDEHSTSGYLLPLNQLWTCRLIDKPTLRAANEVFKSVELVGSHEEVRKRVASDINGLGATWTITKDDPNIVVALTYGLIPQDVIAISSNLSAFENTLVQFFSDSSTLVKLSGQPLNIDNVVGFTLEFKNAYAQLEKIVAVQREYEKSRGYQYFLYHFLIICITGILTALLLKKEHTAERKKFHLLKFLALRLFETTVAMAAMYVGVIELLEGVNFEDFNKFTIALSILLGFLIPQLNILQRIVKMFK